MTRVCDDLAASSVLLVGDLCAGAASAFVGRCAVEIGQRDGACRVTLLEPYCSQLHRGAMGSVHGLLTHQVLSESLGRHGEATYQHLRVDCPVSTQQPLAPSRRTLQVLLAMGFPAAARVAVTLARLACFAAGMPDLGDHEGTARGSSALPTRRASRPQPTPKSAGTARTARTARATGALRHVTQKRSSALPAKQQQAKGAGASSIAVELLLPAHAMVFCSSARTDHAHTPTTSLHIDAHATTATATATAATAATAACTAAHNSKSWCGADLRARSGLGDDDGAADDAADDVVAADGDGDGDGGFSWNGPRQGQEGHGHACLPTSDCDCGDHLACGVSGGQRDKGAKRKTRQPRGRPRTERATVAAATPPGCPSSRSSSTTTLLVTPQAADSVLDAGKAVFRLQQSEEEANQQPGRQHQRLGRSHAVDCERDCGEKQETLIGQRSGEVGQPPPLSLREFAFLHTLNPL